MLFPIKEIFRKTQPFRELLSHAQAAERKKIQLPAQLTRAWLHLLMCLVCYPKQERLFRRHMIIYVDLVEDGMGLVFQEISQGSLLANTVLMPTQLMSLVAFQLLQDITYLSPEINDIYLEYMSSLVRSLARSHRQSPWSLTVPRNITSKQHP